MLITVVTPTCNRPALLREALASVKQQQFTGWEVVVVDDGSSPPVNLDDLPEPIRMRTRLIRHDAPRGPSAARNSGMQSAQGDIVFFLDDDDLLTADALGKIADGFRAAPDLNCLFVNIEPFGRHAPGTLENQTRALAGVLRDLGHDVPPAEGVVLLPSERLFTALLARVPMAFQRVAIRRTQLQKTGGYDGEGFDDLEWYYRVALRSACGLLVQACYRVRCEGQSFFSRTDGRRRLIDAVVRICSRLLGLEEVAASPALKRKVAAALAGAHFNKAWFAYENRLPFPWRSFAASTARGISWPHLSLGGKALMRQLRQWRA